MFITYQFRISSPWHIGQIVSDVDIKMSGHYFEHEMYVICKQDAPSDHAFKFSTTLFPLVVITFMAYMSTGPSWVPMVPSP